MYTNRECHVHETTTLAGPGGGLERVRQALRDGAGRALRRLAGAHARARARSRLRQELEWFDDHLLQDVGARREDLEAEARKPFWRA